MKALFLSATPMTTIDDARTFTIATGATLLDMRPTKKNWKQFAGLLAREPNKPNLAAIKRIRELLSPYIVSFPYVKWPHKAINNVIICEFKCPEDIVLYTTAYTRYVDDCKKAGKSGPGRMAQLVALGQFCKAVEPLRSPEIAERMYNDWKSGYAPVFGCKFIETIQRVVYILVDEYHIPLSKIAKIWGGRRALDPSKLYTEQECNELIISQFRGEPMTKHQLRRLQETISYRTDAIRNRDADTTAQKLRHQKMIEYGLTGLQTGDKRQAEIDSFQSGRAEFCIFTLAAGGVGLSLDQCVPTLRPRRGYFSPTYSGPEAQQALGRTIRRTTYSDVVQSICCMRNTIEENHVAPLLDAKLKCIAQFTRAVTLVDFDAPLVSSKIRTLDEASKDAESEDSQLQEGDSDAGEDEDED